MVMKTRQAELDCSRWYTVKYPLLILGLHEKLLTTLYIVLPMFLTLTLGNCVHYYQHKDDLYTCKVWSCYAKRFREENT